MIWCMAWTESLTRWKEAETDYDKETALLWMGFWACRESLLEGVSREGLTLPHDKPVCRRKTG